MRRWSLIVILSLAACQAAPSQSDLSVTNSESAEGRFLGVVELDLFSNGGRGLCTGSFITKSVILTASHCVADAFQVAVAGVTSQDLIPNPLWNSDNDSSYGFDIALIKFSQDVSDTIVEIAPQVPQPGDRARIVGYGFTDWNLKQDSGQKRTGETLIDEISPEGDAYMIASRGCNGQACSSSETASAVGQGDSGGPLLVGDKIVAIASLGGSDGQNAQSLHAALHQQKNIDFIRQHVPELNLQIATIDSPARAGSQNLQQRQNERQPDFRGQPQGNAQPNRQNSPQRNGGGGCGG